MKNQVYTIGDSITWGYGSATRNVIQDELTDLLGGNWNVNNASVGANFNTGVTKDVKFQGFYVI